MDIVYLLVELTKISFLTEVVTFRVRGRGVAGPRSKGDLLVTVEVAVPQNMTDAERDALRAYAASIPESPRAHLGV